MLSKNYIEAILDYGVCHGADFAEVFYEDVTKSNVTLIDKRIANCISGNECGIGIRFFKGHRTYYFHSADIREETIMRLLKEWGSVKRGSLGRQELGDLNKIKNKSIKRYPKSIAMSEKLELMQRVITSGKSADPSITRARVNYVDMDQRVQIANTEGIFVEDERVKTRIVMTMYAEANGDCQYSYFGPGTMGGFEFYENINLDEYARQTAFNAKAMLNARPCPTGKMPVIIANGFGGLFFHEACGHSLEASSVARGGSEFSYKLGENIASDKVTLIDDGSIEKQWGSLAVDDEGVPTRKNILIENGVLKGYLVDKFNGKRMGMESTGSARRESYRFAPTARMTNTYIAPGNDKLKEMIGTVDRGILVKNINAGSVNSVTGEFNFNTSETFLIENGKIAYPVRNATLIGRGGDILKKVDMVASDYELGQGFCYAGSGAIYIGAGQPSLRVTEMTVGGDEV